MAEIIPEQTIVRVRNTDPIKPFVDVYANQRYVIDPSSDIMVPYFAAVYWFGDPRSVDVGDRNSAPHTQYRSNELDRLRTKYGTYGDAWYPEAWEINDENRHTIDAEGRHVNLPRCEVFDLTGAITGSTNARLFTIIDDPEGTHLKPATQTVNEQAAVQQTIEQLAAQVQKLTNQLAVLDPEAAARLTPFVAPEPSSAPSSTAEIVKGMAGADDDDRDPEPDPDDPAAHAAPDLPPQQRAVAAAKARGVAKKSGVKA